MLVIIYAWNSLKTTWFYIQCLGSIYWKQKIKWKIQGNREYIYKNDLDKTCFQHDMTYGKFKDLDKRTQSDKVLKDKAFENASNPISCYKF